ncbi:MAG: sulfite exporter TauE/SafE family protein [Gammaproteobacteria bacterium]|nr:sulfite exporter TauE/SafE family protein [Gammaproteobacteria bacterium]MCW9089545.1 sulfite exporter TauE/SafE family protein [Gammaproteobacteria bacterium]
MTEWLAYGGLGAFAGLLAGLFGVGGGLVIVPVLALLFAAAGIADEVLMHLAIGTSLATIVFTSISSVWAHQRRGAVRWEVVWQLTPGIVLGAWLGAALAERLSGDYLRYVFGLFELSVALQMGLNLRASPHRSLPGRAGMGLAGGVIGSVSAIVGIGGGTMTVPFLQWCNVPMRQAVATSAACGLPIAVAGATGFLFSGWENSHLPPLSSGYLYWPAFAGIVVASVLFAPLGARLAHTIPAVQLKRFFALFLALLGVRMLLG